MTQVLKIVYIAKVLKLKYVIQYFEARQSFLTRLLHITILILILSQIAVSNFVGFTHGGQVKGGLDFYGTWAHIITGFLILPATIVFIFVVLKNHGLKYFFPYLFGDYSQIKNDIQSIKALTLPEPQAYGIATSVQGLGLGALFLVVFSGVVWYSAWSLHMPWAGWAKDIHGDLTSLIELYIAGHGAMGALHIIQTYRLQNNNGL